VNLKQRAAKLRTACVALQLALRHPATPWYARVCAGMTLFYALAPIDLIPDFLPIIGLLDDVVIVPFGTWLTIKFIPPAVWQECQAEAARRSLSKPAKDWRSVILIVVLWLALLAGGIVLMRWLWP
jgi:uncharacterized membrane protein YkvA (DUF1232 family)